MTDLFRRLAPRVYGYARLRTDADTADEVVADTFVTAWRLRDRIPDNPLPWLLVIARNALANRTRSARRATRLIASMTTIADLARHAPAAGDLVVDRQTLLATVATLRPAEREALVLTAWHGLTIRDAAAVAGCTERTLARRLALARNHLHHAVNTTQ